MTLPDSVIAPWVEPSRVELLYSDIAPVPVVAIVPPDTVLLNTFIALPFAMLIEPPALLMLFWTVRFAVVAPPTLIVPLFVVLPPPSSVRPKALMSIVPAFDSVVICSAWLIVTRPLTLIVAESPAPGSLLQDQSPGVCQRPLAVNVQVAACAGELICRTAAATAAAQGVRRVDFMFPLTNRNGWRRPPPRGGRPGRVPRRHARSREGK